MRSSVRVWDVCEPCGLGFRVKVKTKDITGWGENDRGVSFTFGGDVVRQFLRRHDLDLVVRAHQVVEDGYEFFAGLERCCRWRLHAALRACYASRNDSQSARIVG